MVTGALKKCACLVWLFVAKNLVDCFYCCLIFHKAQGRSTLTGTGNRNIARQMLSDNAAPWHERRKKTNKNPEPHLCYEIKEYENYLNE